MTITRFINCFWVGGGAAEDLKFKFVLVCLIFCCFKREYIVFKNLVIFYIKYSGRRR